MSGTGEVEGGLRSAIGCKHLSGDGTVHPPEAEVELVPNIPVPDLLDEPFSKIFSSAARIKLVLGLSVAIVRCEFTRALSADKLNLEIPASTREPSTSQTTGSG